MPDLALTVGTTIHRGWESIRVTRTLEQLAHNFELSVTDRWAGQGVPRRIKPGEACTIKVDGELLISGYIDTVRGEYDETSHAITIAGRSKAGDLIDCSHPGIDFNQRTLIQIIRDLSEPFGIGVDADVDIGARFERARIAEGESFFECFDRLASYRALRLVSLPTGDLFITRLGSKRIDTALKPGENIQSGRGDFQHSARFSEYLVRSQKEAEGLLF